MKPGSSQILVCIETDLVSNKFIKIIDYLNKPYLIEFSEILSKIENLLEDYESHRKSDEESPGCNVSSNEDGVTMISAGSGKYNAGKIM